MEPLLMQATVLAFGEDSLLTPTELIGIGVGIGIIALLILFALLRRVRMHRPPTVDACARCGSLNIGQRAGLAVCVDCGYSVRLAEVPAD